MRIKRLLSVIALCLIIAILSPTAAYAKDTTMFEPAEVKNLTVTLSADRVYLTWDADASASGYEIYYNCGSGQVLYGTAFGGMFRGKGLTPATCYTFYVYSYNIIGDKMIRSSTAARVSGWTLPAAPSFKVSRTRDIYTLTWSPISGMGSSDYYEILTRLPGAEDWTVEAEVSDTRYTFTCEDVKEMYFSVRAVMVRGGKKYRSEARKKYHSIVPSRGSMIAFGDSISRGTGSQFYAYPEMLARDHHLSLKNYSVSGATLSKSDTEHSICDDVKAHLTPDTRCNYILFEGGYNDYALNRPLGEATPEGAAQFDELTVCGALETMFTHAKTDAPDAVLIFVMVHEVSNTYTKPNALGLNFFDYKEGIFAVCEKYGVPIADVSVVMNTADPAICGQYTGTRYGIYPNGDSIHPNEAGYETYYLPVIDAVFCTVVASIEKHAEEPTEGATEGPTESPTEEPSEGSTEGQTENPTEKPSDGSTEGQTEEPTEGQTEDPTENPTEEPTIVERSLLLGDADGDGEISVMDATMIQRYIADQEVPDFAALSSCGDIDGDGLGITDATYIQRYLAQFTVPFNIGQPILNITKILSHSHS